MSEWNFQDRVHVSFAANGVAEVALPFLDLLAPHAGRDVGDGGRRFGGVAPLLAVGVGVVLASFLFMNRMAASLNDADRQAIADFLSSAP